MYLPKVRQRLNKAQSQGMKMDHDYFTGTAAYLSSTSMEGLLQGNAAGGGYGLQVTAVQNGSVGMLFGLDVLAEDYNEMGDKGKDGLARMVDMITNFDATVSGRKHRKENYLRLDYTAMHKEEPRADGAYKDYFGRQGMTTGQNLEKMRSYFKILDDFDPNFPLFARLFNNGFARDEDAMAFAEGMMVAHPGIFGDAAAPQSIDKLYEMVGAYVTFIAKERPEIIQRMNEKIIAEHRSAGMSVEKLKTDREEKAKKFRAAYAQQIKEGNSGHHGHGGHGAHGAHVAHGEHDEHHEGGHHDGAHHDGGHDEHPTEGHGAAAQGAGAHGDDHGAAAAAHGGASHGSTHGH